MADLKSDGNETAPRTNGHTRQSKGEAVDQHSSSFRSRRKLSKNGSKSWFNKSFDQNILQQSTKPIQPRTIKRQNTVTDFFQNVISKSKSHIQDIFIQKKEKSKPKAVAAVDSGMDTVASKLKVNGRGVEVAEGEYHRKQAQQLYPTMHPSFLYNSCPSLFKNEDFLAPRVVLKPRGSLNRNSKTKDREKHRFMDTTHLIAPADLPVKTNMFIVAGRPTPSFSPAEAAINCSSEHKPVVKNPSLQSSTSSYDILKLKLKSSTSSLVYPKEGKLIESPNLRSDKQRALKPAMLSPLGFSWNTEQDSVVIRKISSAPPNRQRVSSTTDLLFKNDIINKTKRALVKSNSDTFTKRTSLSEPLAKASSEYVKCFKGDTKIFLTSNMNFLGNIMTSVTDYLFLGSVEAAYNERLLCKYNISSLIDMTNLSPTLVPPNKKSDCPCTCVNNTHFRSKLNIGVDDIEWENLDQYFDEINVFIHGARKKGRCVLVFSYLGQSRAPTAVIQHLMQHFKLSYKAALDIVQGKRPQTQLNSGFVKALLRLEKQMDLQACDMQVGSVDSEKMDDSFSDYNGSVEAMNGISVRPVVREAWLEC